MYSHAHNVFPCAHGGFAENVKYSKIATIGQNKSGAAMVLALLGKWTKCLQTIVKVCPCAPEGAESVAIASACVFAWSMLGQYSPGETAARAS